jgi:imidazolonepropionase-like amidohydrolase
MTLPDLVLSADWLIDGTGAAPRRRPRLTVRAGRIHAVAADVPGGVAFPGCTILPGLIDTHVHLAFDAGPTHAAVVAGLRGLDEPALTARALANGQKALRAGVTTVRDCGSPFWVGQIVRDAVRRGHVAGPDVVACGSPITTAGGHLHYLGTLAATAAEVRVAAERLLDGPARVDALKVIATGGNMTPGSDRLACQYDEAALRAAVEVGRRHGAATAAHVLCRAAIGPCSAAGVRTLEHCLWRVGPGPGDFAFDPELARQLVDRGQYAGFTMSAPTWPGSTRS